MKNLTRFSILVIIAVSLLIGFSCSKDDNNGPTAPPTPNFEDISPYMWDYNSVLSFDLDYATTKAGIAEIDITLTAKGEDAIASLTVNNIPVLFDYVTSYTKGKVYSFSHYATGPIQISTTQPVTYSITYNTTTTYSGTMDLPDQVIGNFPAFVQTNNYAPNWTLGEGNQPLDFQVISAYVNGPDWETRDYVRQVAGTVRDYTLPSTFWSGLNPISYFNFQVSPIVYRMKDSNKLLTVGISTGSYTWENDKGSAPQAPKTNLSKIMDLIHLDANK